MTTDNPLFDALLLIRRAKNDVFLKAQAKTGLTNTARNRMLTLYYRLDEIEMLVIDHATAKSIAELKKHGKYLAQVAAGLKKQGKKWEKLAKAISNAGKAAGFAAKVMAGV